MSTTQNASLGNVTIEIAGMEVTLPVKFAPGHILTDNQAKVLDAAYQRQFTNNQNASAKSRAEALAKATTDTERNAKQPLTASEIATLYTDYEPSVGGGPRQSSMEKMRSEAAWRAWTVLVGEHNDSISNGGDPVIVKAGNKPVGLPSGKGAPEKREAMSAALLAKPEYAERIQAQLDLILAERGTKKPEGDADQIVVSSDELV
jgi:hypothetical protein